MPANWWQPRTTPMRSISSTQAQSSMLVSSTLPAAATPALLISTSSPPQWFITESSSCCQWFGLVISSGIAKLSPAWDSISESVLQARCSSISVTATLQPRDAYRRANAAPNPLPAPVIAIQFFQLACLINDPFEGKNEYANRTELH